jgi:hypothetical protein
MSDGTDKLLKQFGRGQKILNNLSKEITKLKPPLSEEDRQFAEELGEALDNLTKELDAISERLEKDV